METYALSVRLCMGSSTRSPPRITVGVPRAVRSMGQGGQQSSGHTTSNSLYCGGTGCLCGVLQPEHSNPLVSSTIQGFGYSRVDHIINDFWCDGPSALHTQPLVSSSVAPDTVSNRFVFAKTVCEQQCQRRSYTPERIWSHPKDEHTCPDVFTPML